MVRPKILPSNIAHMKIRYNLTRICNGKMVKYKDCVNDYKYGAMLHSWNHDIEHFDSWVTYEIVLDIKIIALSVRYNKSDPYIDAAGKDLWANYGFY